MRCFFPGPKQLSFQLMSLKNSQQCLRATVEVQRYPGFQVQLPGLEKSEPRTAPRNESLWCVFKLLKSLLVALLLIWPIQWPGTQDIWSGTRDHCTHFWYLGTHNIRLNFSPVPLLSHAFAQDYLPLCFLNPRMLVSLRLLHPQPQPIICSFLPWTVLLEVVLHWSSSWVFGFLESNWVRPMGGTRSQIGGWR